MTVRRSRALLRAVLVGGSAVALAVGGCSRELTLGSDQPSTAATAGIAGTLAAGSAGASGSSGSGGSSGAAGSINLAGAAGEAPCVVSACRGKVYECGNCQDDDGDGRIDAEDPECTGPCDDAEDSLSVGLPGESSTACQQDCYFDSGNGAGAGDCRFSQHCDPLSVAPDYPPTGDSGCAYDEAAKIPGTNVGCSELRVAQPAGCLDSCGPLTPNGCDCFGCCQLPAGGNAYVWLETGLPCTPVDACMNHCDPCEVCVGRPDPLPSCGDPGGSGCSTAYRPCGGADGERCQAGAYCITGCCIPEPR